MKKVILMLVIILLLFGGVYVEWRYLRYQNPIGISSTPIIPQESSIEVASPEPHQAVTSSFVVSGRARGSWYFEAVFPVRLVDERGRLLTSTQARAKSDWMTNDFVPFEARIFFPVKATTTASLILNNDNPSGNPATSKSELVPVLLVPSF